MAKVMRCKKQQKVNTNHQVLSEIDGSTQVKQQRQMVSQHMYMNVSSQKSRMKRRKRHRQLEVTRYVDITGNEVQETEEGTHQPRYIIGDKWRYSGVTVTENGITKHVYERIQSKVPNDAPQETPVQ